MPGAFEQAVADADAFFRQELPALQQWRFTQAEGRRIAQPVLLMFADGAFRPSASDASCCCRDCRIPSSPTDLPEATHLLHVVQPGATAAELRGVLGSSIRSRCDVRSHSGARL